MKRNYHIALACLFLLCILSPVYAGTIDKNWEKQVSERLANKADATEVLWIEANGGEFLGLYNRHTSEKAHGAAIILHAMGGHADWPQTIAPIRQILPEHGWATLSIQLPVIAPENQIENYGATLQEAVARIRAAVRFLRKRKFLNIVAIGHSFGAASTLAYLEKEPKQKILALAAIGLQDYAFVKPSIDILKLIEKSSIPILDIYGSRDFRRVIDQAPDRRLAANKGNNNVYDQYEIEGADHYFNKMEDVLIKRLYTWLDKAAPGVSIAVDKDFDGNSEDEKEQEPATPTE